MHVFIIYYKKLSEIEIYLYEIFPVWVSAPSGVGGFWDGRSPSSWNEAKAKEECKET